MGRKKGTHLQTWQEVVGQLVRQLVEHLTLGSKFKGWNSGAASSRRDNGQREKGYTLTNLHVTPLRLVEQSTHDLKFEGSNPGPPDIKSRTTERKKNTHGSAKAAGRGS